MLSLVALLRIKCMDVALVMLCVAQVCVSAVTTGVQMQLQSELHAVQEEQARTG